MDDLLLVHSPVATLSLTTSGHLVSVFDSLGEELVKSLSGRKVICDSNKAYEFLKNSGIQTDLQINHPELKVWRINRFTHLQEDAGQVNTYSDYKKLLREGAVAETRTGVKENAAKADEVVAQIIHGIDDLQKSGNLAANRLSELYSLHFPEMVDIISNVATLAKIIVEQPQRLELTSEILSSFGLPKGKIELILSFQKSSLGGELGSSSLVPVQDYASSLIGMEEKLQKLERWIDDSMSSIAPNLTAVSGPNVGARLISAMGSLRALAMKSSSKIQILGAEKALYSSLRSGGSPPKHGIIFQIPEIGNSPYWIRGKIARSFAAKIVIAARLDYFKGEFLGESMKQELRKYEQELRKKHPDPPPKKPTRPDYTPQKRRRKRR